MNDKKRKLNLGCGNIKLPGYINTDIKTGPKFSAYPLNVLHGDYDEIRASHLLEHFSYRETAAVLADWVSKLKPGGILKIAVPDFDKIMRDADEKLFEPYLMGSHTDEYDYHKAIFTTDKLTKQLQNAGLVNIGNWQDGQKDSASLPVSLNLGGMKPIEGVDVTTIDDTKPKIIPFESEKTIDAPVSREDVKRTPPKNIAVEKADDIDEVFLGLADVDLEDKRPYPRATKYPGIVEVEPINKWKRYATIESVELLKIATEKARLDALAVTDKPIRFQAVMSMPRLAHSENMFCALNVFGKLGINVERATGAFWEQGLTRMMEKFTNDGFDYLITIDYDTYYTIEQVQYLCQLAISNPDVDAIVPLQAMREKDVMLMGWKAPDGTDAADFMKEEIGKKELVDITTGHFGLTIIKCDALKTIGKPWFNSIPGPDGSWNDGRIDADIYFWHNMAKCGKRVCLAPQIKIGHLQQMATFPGTLENGLQPEHHYMTDINAKGLPEHCKISRQ